MNSEMRLGTRAVTCLAPNTTGWIGGNFYTSGGSFKGSGWALRDYFSYVRSWC